MNNTLILSRIFILFLLTISTISFGISKEQKIIEKNRHRDRLLEKNASWSHKFYEFAADYIVIPSIFLFVAFTANNLLDKDKYDGEAVIGAISLASLFGSIKISKYIKTPLEKYNFDLKQAELDFEKRKTKGTF